MNNSRPYLLCAIVISLLLVKKYTFDSRGIRFGESVSDIVLTDTVIPVPVYTGALFDKPSDTVEVTKYIFYRVNGVRKVKIK